MITSRQNQQVKDWIKLKSKKERNRTKTYFVETEHLVLEALKANVLVTLIVSEHYHGNVDFPEKIIVSQEVAEKLSSTKSVVDIFGVVKMQPHQTIGSRCLFLEDLQDPGNVGTLLRSAISFGIQTIFYTPQTADIYSDKVLRAAQGAHFHLSCIEVDTNDCIELVKQHQLQFVTTFLHSKLKSVSEMPKHHFCLALGNEGSGLSQQLLPVSDLNVLVTMSDFESLNVAIAGSILLYLSQEQV